MLRLPIVLAVLTLAFAPLPQIDPRSRMPNVAVLEWHDVLPEKAVYFDTTTATLAADFDEIARRGFHVVPLWALRDHLVNGKSLPPKSLVLTFDDNSQGIYDNAFPLLRKHRFHATLFVHTNYVGKTTSKAHNTWPELNEMQRSGLVDIQSLTANHPPDLTVLKDADVMHEFQLSAHSIEVRGGRKPYAVVYPYDVYDDHVAQLAAAAGYTLGFTEDHGLAGESPSLLEIHRYSLAPQEQLFETALDDVASR